MVCRVTLTCVALRDPETVVEGAPALETPKDPLPKEPCLEALAQLRHAKWYQVMFNLKLATIVYDKRQIFFDMSMMV